MPKVAGVNADLLITCGKLLVGISVPLSVQLRLTEPSQGGEMNKSNLDALDASLAKLENNRRGKTSSRHPSSEKNITAEIPQADVVQHDNSLQQLSYSDQIFTDLDFSHSQSEEKVWVNCEFHQCDFSFASLAFLQANNCKFYDCNFKQSNLKEALFSQCSFYDRDRQLGCNFYAADLTNAKFSKADISLCVFERSSMFGVEVVDCQAQGSSFKMADFSSLIRRNKPFYSAFLNNSNFRYADFSGCQLVKCDLAGSTFTSANFLDADLQDCTLCAADLSAIQFETLSLAGADLRNAQMTDLDIRKVDLKGAKINDWQQPILLASLGVVVFPD